MSTFQYTAWTSDGLRQGVVVRSDAAEVTDWLESQGWVPLEVQAFAAAARRAPDVPARLRIRRGDLILLLRQLEALTRAGVPFTQALSVAADQTGSPRLECALRQVKRAADEGSLLSDALQARPHVFPDVFVCLVRAGEHAGLLPVALPRLRGLLEQDEAIRAALRRAIFGAAALLAGPLLAILALARLGSLRFLPFLRPAEARALLPKWSSAVLGEIVNPQGLFFLAGLGIAIIAGILFLSTPPGRDFRDRCVLRLPRLGRLFLLASEARLARGLAALLDLGLPLSAALEAAARLAGNHTVEQALLDHRKGLLDGQPLALALEQSRVASPLLVKLASRGEETGTLEELLEEAAECAEAEIHEVARRSAAGLGFSLLAGMAGVVALVGAVLFIRP